MTLGGLPALVRFRSLKIFGQRQIVATIADTAVRLLAVPVIVGALSLSHSLEREL